MPRFVVKALFQTYRKLISPALQLLAGAHQGCRFEPSCSIYSEQAIETHGIFKGLALTFGRVLRCNPFSRGGTDPVPCSNPKMKRVIANAVSTAKGAK